MSEPDVFIEPKALSEFIANIFARLGSNDAEAEAIATSLVETSLMGHDSHGVSIVPRYVTRALDGTASIWSGSAAIRDAKLLGITIKI